MGDDFTMSNPTQLEEHAGPSIPGLSLMKPSIPKRQPDQSENEIPSGSGLLDTLMQHVDSQSGVRGSALSSEDNTATRAASLVAEEGVLEEGRRTSDAGQTGTGDVTNNEHECSSTSVVGMGTPASTEENGRYIANGRLVEKPEDKVDGKMALPNTSVATVREEEYAGLTDTSSHEQDASSAPAPKAASPRHPTPPTVSTTLLDDSRQEPTVKDEESVNVNGTHHVGQKEESQDRTALEEPQNQNSTATSLNEVRVDEDGGFMVEKANSGDALSSFGVHDQTAEGLDENRSLPNARQEEHGASQTDAPGPNVEAEIRTTQVETNEAEQRATDAMTTENELGKQENRYLEISTEADTPIASLREQLPAISIIEQPQNDQGGQDAEWEADSSPIDSSSDSDSTSDTTSTDDSDEDDVDVDGDYAMLDPEEQARILMQGDGGSDDEGNARSGAKGGTTHLRTANEKPEEVVPKPDIQVTEDMRIEELGCVEAIVENAVLIKAKTSGEYRVLESNSLLCLQNRSVVGVVSETLGRVQQPLYTIRFTNEEAIKEAGLGSKNTPVYYVEQHSTFVFTQPLRAVKGSDASNFHDEEVGAEEMEFSDDEAEAEHKRRLKLKKQSRKDERNDRSGYGRGNRGASMNGHARRTSSVNGDTAAEMNYDDISPIVEDGYTPLARPTNLHEMMGRGEAPLEGRQPVPFSDRGYDRGRGRGRGRGNQGRGDRGNRGDRSGRGRVGRGRPNDNQPPDRKGSFSNSQQASPTRKSEASSSPKTSAHGNQHQHQHQHQQSPQQPQPPTFALPPIPPPSQYPYPQMPPQPPHPPFSYQKPTLPHAPTIAPQASSYSTFSPSPISPLPQTHLNFNHYATQHNQHHPPAQAYHPYQPQQQHQPPYQDHSQQWQGPFHGGQQGQVQGHGQGQPPMPPPGSHINPAFFDALRQQRGGGGGGGGGGAGNWQDGR
ncbi:hypothetical protein EPUS_00102 [Endocarpon pusillum Z07020]|uniref:H/ACA ribonucleoprotein complex non-core subunit NAF1 n=1 Tax=Endocarpon pusillum (strain Z07020 / HMAS-L-300199) TaxID=1263415 RepID=U1HWZ0_ENDPU|nr:uncharacterized protein EPUS_00102 [Endocarpon pusillum Z07020]ERF75310.1 hypothetical protein EPUS_00102 [Endocarpon pusillum Z07020]